MLRAAAQRSSVHRARAQSRRGCSDRTSRWLFGHLSLRTTQRAVTLCLRRQIRPFVPQEPVDVAIDFTDRPYYGQPQDPKRRQYVRTKEERGTHRAHRFASLSLLLPRFRFIASLRFHPSNGGTLRAVQRALYDFRQAGGQLRAVFLDRGFYNYAVLSWLKAQGIIRGGPGPPRLPSAGTLGARARLLLDHAHAKGAEARGPSARAHDPCRGPLPEGEEVEPTGLPGPGLYAVVGEMSLAEVAKRYRGRFGIESSYRVMGQALARTSSRSPALRLLQVAVGMMLQNEWAVLKLLYASESRKGTGGWRVRNEWLRFADLLTMLMRAVGYRLGNLSSLENRRPFPGPRRCQGYEEFLDA